MQPPDIVLDAYLVTIERDEAKVATLREKVQQFKAIL